MPPAFAATRAPLPKRHPVHPGRVPRPIGTEGSDATASRQRAQRKARRASTGQPLEDPRARLATLLALTLVLSGGEKNSEPRPKPKTLAVTLEKKFSRQVDRVEQDLRPVMAEQGAEGTAYRVKEGSTSCRKQDGGPSLVCLVWLIDGEGTSFSLTYSLTSADGSCWEATPDGAKLADGRPVPIDRAKLPPLDYCLDSPASPPPSEEATDADSACDPSYPDFCIPPPPPDHKL
jgi:hypothetical protein